MVTYVLDSSAVLRFLENEAGGERIEAVLRERHLDKAEVVISAVHWGEVAGYAYKTRGRAEVDRALQQLRGLGVRILPVTAEQAVTAALIKIDHKVPYVDAFGPAIAFDPDHVFITADFDFKPLAQLAKIEFLPPK